MQDANKYIDNLLLQYKTVLAGDYDKYRNHLYRVYSNCILIDDDISNQEKYAIAAVFHDIGIWTNHTFDYLNPSIEQVKIYLAEIGKHEWIDEITAMIYWHHKISEYSGNHGTTVENFRKADWIDVSLGIISFGLDKKTIKQNKKIYPNKGFHIFLIKQTIKNLFRHPLNPLPVFKI